MDSNNNIASSWSETAYEWLQRSARKRRLAAEGAGQSEAEILRPPYDSSSAAWAFVQGGYGVEGTGTGITFIDAALKHCCQCYHGGNNNNDDGEGEYNVRKNNILDSNQKQEQQLPIIDIRSKGNCGKTWTIVTLAAKFVVATRPSLWKENIAPQVTADANNNNYCYNTNSPSKRKMQHEHQEKILPQVIILDSTFDVTVAKLAYAILSSVAAPINTSVAADTIYTDHSNDDIESCMSRIHIFRADDISSWVAILESIRYQMSSSYSNGDNNGNDSVHVAEEDEGEQSRPPPTLILWDGFLSEPDSDKVSRMEVIRQLMRLINDSGNQFLLITTASRIHYEWDKYVSCKIRLERSDREQQQQEQYEQHELFLASVVPSNNNQKNSTMGIGIANKSTTTTAKFPYSLSMTGVIS